MGKNYNASRTCANGNEAKSGAAHRNVLCLPHPRRTLAETELLETDDAVQPAQERGMLPIEGIAGRIALPDLYAAASWG